MGRGEIIHMASFISRSWLGRFHCPLQIISQQCFSSWLRSKLAQLSQSYYTITTLTVHTYPRPVQLRCCQATNLYNRHQINPVNFNMIYDGLLHWSGKERRVQGVRRPGVEGIEGQGRPRWRGGGWRRSF